MQCLSSTLLLLRNTKDVRVFTRKLTHISSNAGEASISCAKVLAVCLQSDNKACGERASTFCSASVGFTASLAMKGARKMLQQTGQQSEPSAIPLWEPKTSKPQCNRICQRKSLPSGIIFFFPIAMTFFLTMRSYVELASLYSILLSALPFIVLQIPSC